MSRGSTLYRFKVSLSDVERSVYETLDFRVAMHASESEAFLLTRVLAYILNFEEGLEFSQGLAVPDEPAIRLPGANGAIAKWIDIGNPTARRMHKASKACRAVRIYTYKDSEILRQEAAGENVHRASEIEVFALDPKFLQRLAPLLSRENQWSVIHDEGELIVTAGEETLISHIESSRLQEQA